MQVILDFLTQLGQMVVFLVDFVISTIADLVYMTRLLGEVMVFLPDYFGWLPSAVVTFIMLIISIVVIYKIIGREG